MDESLLNDPIAIFLTIMGVVLITPLLSERVRLPGIVGLVVGGMLVGPYGLGLLKTDQLIEALSLVGLIYLMFNAGLDVDLNQFRQMRNKALVFGVFTFSIPLLMGITFGLALGLNAPAAVLLGSAFSSHTLLALPIVARKGLMSSEPVAVTVGATVFTDVAAFLVLAVIASVQGEGFSGTYVLTLLLLMAGYALVILLGLPRIGKLFFRRYANETVEFQFVLVALFVAGLLAELIGMHAVVGAFIAGIAINSALPHRSPVIGRVLFVGQAFFIPIFLVYSGMITDPGAFVRGADVLLIGAAITAIGYVSKLLAAWVAARIYGYSRDELLLIWGLSQAQAAVTLPTIIIGLELGLFNDAIFNGVMLMILFTSLSSPLIVEHFARRVHPAKPRGEGNHLFARVLVPVANPATQQHLLDLANILTRNNDGTLYALTVVPASPDAVREKRRQLDDDRLNDPETHAVPLCRVAPSISQGVIHAALEQQATLVVMGWRGKPTLYQSVLGTVLDEVVWGIESPVIVGRIARPINGTQRVIMVVPPHSFTPTLVNHALTIVTAISNALNVPLDILCAPEYLDLLRAAVKDYEIERGLELVLLNENAVQQVAAHGGSNDLLVVTTTGSRTRFRSSLGHFPEQLATATPESLLVVHHN